MDKGNIADLMLDVVVAVGPLPTTFFRDYLGNMEAFFENELQEYDESLKAIKRKIELGELTAPSDPGQMPSEMQYVYYAQARIEGFVDILRKSCLVSLYTAIESRLLDVR